MNNRLCVCVIALLAIQAVAWGKTGHETIGRVAAKLLRPETLKNIQKYLVDSQGDLGIASTWADSVDHSGEYEWTKDLHYINTPDWQCKFYSNQNCANNVCVWGAIVNFTHNCQANAIPAADDFKFLIHFIEDVHQPMHVSFASDEGGNSIHVDYIGKSVNLHQVWDDEIIYTRMDNDFNKDAAKFADHILQSAKAAGSIYNFNLKDISTQAAEWANESAGLACTYAYSQPDGSHVQTGGVLKLDYYTRGMPKMEEQLVKASLRLTSTLESLYGPPAVAIY